MINIIFWITLGLICWTFLGMVVARIVGKAASCKLPDDWWAYRNDLATFNEKDNRERIMNVSSANQVRSHQGGHSGEAESV